jgi:hypothetical protein
MKLSAIALAIVFFTSMAPLQSNAAEATTEKKLSSSQQRMVGCNKEAVGKKGQERRDFMRQCMRGDNAPAAMVSQENKMKACNQQAGEKSLKGPERKTFMSDCLKS